ncbi:FtsX-like permease family protein [Pseudoalteromonas sp. PS5]|uniref:FtsX-like permease family protein n=1 Tax=Pseudoalteromonas sp. PS5 TaxID=1437473 RepID=UPI001F4FB295|nr:FtsX-like permease family protein [Pseudoalteromonas sp. PS5]
MVKHSQLNMALPTALEIRLILGVFFQFYRRHLWLFFLFVLGLSLGSALLGAIQGLNQEANNRYHQTSALINNPISHFVRPIHGSKTLEATIWQALRKAGVRSTEPVAEGVVTIVEGQKVRIKGVNTLQWLGKGSQSDRQQNQNPSMQFGFNTIYISNALAERFSLKQHQSMQIAGVDCVFFVLPGLSGNTALADIALVDRLLHLEGKISYIEISDFHLNSAQVNAIITNKARLQSAEAQSFDSLSQAFFFNLKALALLGYVVGAFLSFNAIKLCLHSRQKLHQQLILLGCLQRTLVVAVSIEIILLSFLAALLGAGIAFVGSNALVAEITLALKGLFELDRHLPVHFSWVVVLQAFMLNMLVLASIAYAQTNVLIFHRKKRFQVLCVIGAGLIAGYFYIGSDNPFFALGLCVCLLLVFFIITPVVLRISFACIPTTRPLLKWMKADSHEQIRVLTTSVYAVLLAVGTSVGLQIMVASFSTALQIHLDSRLSAELYIRPNHIESWQYQWLSARQEVDTVGVFWQAEGSYQRNDSDPNTQSVRLISFGSHADLHQNLTLLSGAPPTSKTLYHEASIPRSGCLANEPSKLLHGIRLGQYVTIKQGERQINCEITGFYYDYGEQRSVFVVVTTAILQAKFNYEAFGFSLRLKEGADELGLKQQLLQQFELTESQVVENHVFKKYATQLFEHTFYATNALNLMIVVIALFGLWVSLLTLGVKQVQPLAVLKTLGITTLQAFQIKLSQSSIILLVSLVLAMVLGGLLGWVLLKFVMPVGFGWSIPFLIPYQSIMVFIMGIYSLALLVSIAPLIKFSRYAVADLLHED